MAEETEDKPGKGPFIVHCSFSNDKVPAFVEQKAEHKPWVKYGEINNYPEFISTLFDRSAKNNSIITSKQLYITGKGFVFDPEGMQGDDIATLRAFIDQANPYETLNDVLTKTVLDNEIFGGFYLRVVHDKKGKSKYLYHQDYTTVRSNKDNTSFYICEKWVNEDGTERLTIPEDEIIELPAYDPDKKQKESIYYFKSYRPRIKTYSLPEYIGGVEAIITDAEIANFHRACIQNGFQGGVMIVYKDGVPATEEQKTVERKLKSKFTGTDKANSIVIAFVDDPQRTPEVIQLGGNDFDKRYDALNSTIQQEIFVSHKVVSPMLFGIRVEGQLGGRNEMVDAFNLFQNTYITPKQIVQERVYNLFAPIKGKLKIKPVEPIMPSFSEQTLLMILDKNEMREIIGRQPLAPEQVVQQQEKMRCEHFNKDADDLVDLEVFMKYGEPVSNFATVKHKKFMFGKHSFALDNLEQGVLDLIKKTPGITPDDLQKVMQRDKTSITDAVETLAAMDLIEVGDGDKITITKEGAAEKIKPFSELFIRYRYVLRPDAPPLLPNGESRAFCKAMMENPRYFSREDIENIGNELGQIYGIPDYDAFRRRGGYYSNPYNDTTFPFCRHIFQQSIVKRA